MNDLCYSASCRCHVIMERCNGYFSPYPNVLQNAGILENKRTFRCHASQLEGTVTHFAGALGQNLTAADTKGISTTEETLGVLPTLIVPTPNLGARSL